MKKKLASILLLMSILLISCQKEAIVSEQMDETFYVRNGSVDIPAFVYGNGESKVFVLLLHGGPGGNGLDYRFGNYYKELEKNYAVVYTDQRHQGNSHGHLKDDQVSIDIMVEDVHLLVSTLKARYGNDLKIFMLGHSWGGTLGTAYMIKDNYQHDVTGWIEVDGAHDIPMLNLELVKMIQTIGANEVAMGRNVSEWQKMIDFVNELDLSNITNDQSGTLNGYGHAIEALLSQISPASDGTPDIVKGLFFSPNNSVNSGLTSLFLPEDFNAEIETKSMTNDLHKITIPTLLQWGKYDFVVPPALGYSAYDKISSTHKYLKIYESSGHSPMNNQPDIFVKDIVDFIEAHK